MFGKLNITKETIRQFLIVCITSEFIYYVYAIQNTCYEPYRMMLGLTNTQLGMVMTVQGWVAFFGGIPSAWVLNRFSARNLQAINLALSGLTCFYMISPIVSYAGMIVVGVIWGFTLEAFYWGAVTKSVRCMFPDEKQGIAFGSMEMTRGLTNVVVNMIFVIGLFALLTKQAEMTEVNSIRIIMAITGVLLVISGLLAYKLLPNENYLKSTTKSGKSKESMKGVIACLKIPQLWLCGFMGMGVYAVFIGTRFFQPFLKDVFGVPQILISVFAIVGTAYVRMFAGPVSGIIANNVLKSTAKWMNILFGIGIAIFVCIIVLPISKSLVWPVTILLIVLQIVVFMLRGVYYAPIGESGIPREYSGSAMAIAILLIQSPMCWASLVFGSLIDKYQNGMQAYKIIFIIMAALYGIGFVAAWILNAYIKKNGKKIKVTVSAQD